MRAALLLLALLAACPRSHREPPDAGSPKPLVLKLSRPAIETEGERWVPERDAWHSYLHHFAGTRLLTVEFPSGRRWASVVTMVSANLNDDTRVRHVGTQLGRYTTWNEAFAAAGKQLEALGVDRRYRDEWEAKLRVKRVEYPYYPVEGCLGVTTGIKEAGTGRWYVTIDFDEYSPRDWRELHAGWPDTCPASGALHPDAGPGQP